MTTTSPISRFAETLARASDAAPPGFDPTACALATADERGRPSVRFVLLKAADERGFVFYTSFDSRKAAELGANARASLVFYWPWIGEQVRIEGDASRVGDLEADAYFASRDRASQIGAWASKQSAVLGSREELDAAARAVEERFAGKAIERPSFWGGFRVAPDRIEFWRAGAARLHDREAYVRDGAGGWTILRLYP